MSHTNPQIEEQLEKLATICCSQLEGENSTSTVDEPTVDALLKSLLMSGYARGKNSMIQVDIENRVKQRCQEPAMHRGGALSSIVSRLHAKFDELKRWESRQPDNDSNTKSGNISSATEA